MTTTHEFQRETIHDLIGGVLALPASPRCFELADNAERLGTLLETQNDEVTVINAGLLKAGKSSLFNALIGEQNHFATDEVRCTIQSELFATNGYQLIDTPGIDAFDEDTQEAERALRSADLILFAHNVEHGEFEEPEIQFLRHCLELFPDPEERRHRLVPVFTKIDRVSDEDARGIVKAALSQWERFLGTAPERHFVTSASRYFAGSAPGKEKLQVLSGIPELRQFLQGRSSELLALKGKLHRERLVAELDALDDILCEMESDVEDTLERDAEYVRSRKAYLVDEMEELLDTIGTRYAATAR